MAIPQPFVCVAFITMIDPTKLLRSAFLALALLFLAPLGVGGTILGVEAAQAATVGKISVVGNSEVDDATVVKYLALKVGDVATPGKLSASVDALQATGLFKSVNVTMQGSTLVVKVAENSIVSSVLFEGNQRFSDANLVAMIDLENRVTVDQAGLDLDFSTIKQAYTDSGFTNVSVTTRLEPVGAGRVRVVFVINEGGRTGVAAINFTGNNSISGWSLKSIIKTHETSWLSWLLKDDSYTQDQLEQDRVLIQQYYANHGFPDAQVTSAVAEFDAKRNGYFVTYTIVEGDRYTFGKVGVETSIAGLDANNLTNTIRTRKGDRCNRAMVTAGKSHIEALGFFSKVDISAQPGSAADKIILNINVTETSTGDYGITAGYDSQSGLLGELSITARNFLGRGQDIKASIGAS